MQKQKYHIRSRGGRRGGWTAFDLQIQSKYASGRGIDTGVTLCPPYTKTRTKSKSKSTTAFAAFLLAALPCYLALPFFCPCCLLVAPYSDFWAFSSQLLAPSYWVDFPLLAARLRTRFFPIRQVGRFLVVLRTWFFADCPLVNNYLYSTATTEFIPLSLCEYLELAGLSSCRVG